MTLSLAGKTALITGGASGIGKAMAERFHAAGAAILIADLNSDAAAATAASLGKAADHIRIDHTQEADCQAAVQKARDRFGSLDLLLNNAGMPSQGALSNLSYEDIQQVLAVNVLGPMAMAKAALPALRESAAAGREPAMLFTASIQSLMVRPNFSLYGTSKHAITGMVGSLALELAPQGIRVNAVCPGPTDTPLFRTIAAKVQPDFDRAVEQFRAGIPLGRLIAPEDVADAALFLCSAMARSLTGVMLPVDGGLTAR